MAGPRDAVGVGPLVGRYTGRPVAQGREVPTVHVVPPDAVPQVVDGAATPAFRGPRDRPAPPTATGPPTEKVGLGRVATVAVTPVVGEGVDTPRGRVRPWTTPLVAGRDGRETRRPPSSDTPSVAGPVRPLVVRPVTGHGLPLGPTSPPVGLGPDVGDRGLVLVLATQVPGLAPRPPGPVLTAGGRPRVGLARPRVPAGGAARPGKDTVTARPAQARLSAGQGPAHVPAAPPRLAVTVYNFTSLCFDTRDVCCF